MSQEWRVKKGSFIRQSIIIINGLKRVFVALHAVYVVLNDTIMMMNNAEEIVGLSTLRKLLPSII